MAQTPTPLYCDVIQRLRKLSPASQVNADALTVWQGERRSFSIFFLDNGQFLDYSAFSVKLAIGNPNLSPTSGTFTLTYGGNTTTALAYNISAAALQTALQVLASIGAGNCSVVATSSGALIVTFTGTLAAQPIAAMTSDGSALEPPAIASVEIIEPGQVGPPAINAQQAVRLRQTPAALCTSFTAYPNTVAAVTEIQAGSSTANEIQQVTLTPPAVGGGFSLTVPARTMPITSIASGVLPGTNVNGMTTTVYSTFQSAVVQCSGPHGMAVGTPFTFATLGSPTAATNTFPGTFSGETQPIDTPATGTIYFAAIPIILGTALTTMPANSFAYTNAFGQMQTGAAASATGATISQTTLELPFNATGDAVANALQALPTIGRNVTVTAAGGTTSQTFTVTWGGIMSAMEVPLMTLTGIFNNPLGIVGLLPIDEPAIDDLLGSLAQVLTDLAVIVTDADNNSTVIIQEQITLQSAFPTGAYTYTPPSFPPFVVQAAEFKQAIGNGVALVSVVFGTALSAAWHFIGLYVTNTVDGSPLTLFPGTVVSRSTTGFTVQLNGPTDSSNYKLEGAVALD